MKRILLFDIDSTLVETIYDKDWDPIIPTLSEVYEKPISLDGVDARKFQGGTAQSIIGEMLRANGLSITEHPEKLAKTFALWMEKTEEYLKSKKMSFNPLPNVGNMLEYCRKSGYFDLALVTGNPIEMAELKLRYAGIDPEIFKREYDGKLQLIGAFGNDHS